MIPPKIVHNIVNPFSHIFIYTVLMMLSSSFDIFHRSLNEYKCLCVIMLNEQIKGLNIEKLATIDKMFFVLQIIDIEHMLM